MIPKRAFGFLLIFGVAISLIVFYQTIGFSIADYFFGPYGPVVPITTHIVLFQFKDGTAPFTIKEITSKFFGLKKACVHPETQRPYILSITGGKDISIENLQDGISHAFILHFDSNEARDYYVNLDPVHQAFKEAAGEVLQKTLVVDFQDDVFTENF